jgi:chaperone required for assembly of F1-ATPase
MTKKPLPIYSIRPGEKGPTLYRDEKPLETPRNLPVSVPTDRIAQALLAECRLQEERLDLRKMPMMQMTLTAIDITSKQHREIVDGIMRYGESELLCQRASEPPDLVAAQSESWQPYLDWCKTKFGADLRLGSGIVPFEQESGALGALRTFIDPFEPFLLTGVSEAVGISGSLVLGLALTTGHADVSGVLAASELDNLWQSKKWGEDPASLARQEDIRRELENCARWLTLVAS